MDSPPPAARRGIPIPSRLSHRSMYVFALATGRFRCGRGWVRGFGRGVSEPVGRPSGVAWWRVVPYVFVTRGRCDVESRERRICRLLTVWPAGCPTAPGFIPFFRGSASRPLVLEMDSTVCARARAEQLSAFLCSPSSNPTKRSWCSELQIATEDSLVFLYNPRSQPDPGETVRETAFDLL
jgi:hypothetical protein